METECETKIKEAKSESEITFERKVDIMRCLLVDIFPKPFLSRILLCTVPTVIVDLVYGGPVEFLNQKIISGTSWPVLDMTSHDEQFYIQSTPSRYLI